MNFKSVPEKTLIHLVREGDCEAFREVYQRFWKKMYLVALGKLGDDEVVEGILQDVFLKLWERRADIQVENLEAYLVSAMKYACINHIKSEMVREKYVNYASAAHADTFCNADEALNVQELMGNIEERLRQFPEKAQCVFRLNKLENRSTKEISRQLNMSQRTVEHHIQLVVKALRFYLKEYL